MISIYSITGSIIVLFFLLASVNGLKKYVESPIVLAIAKQHRVFGMLATLTAFVHMGYALSQGQLRPTGAITLLALIATGLFGALYATQKKTWMYIAHRIMGPVTIVFIIIHVIFNSSI
jgi:succinate dehydrogenase/fumarate reductase cytochrome b subunit